MKKISIRKARKYGLKMNSSLMENGEKRFRLICTKDKTAYGRTEGGKKGYWQNSHYHKNMSELYVVQNGKILFAKYRDNQLEIIEVDQNGICTAEPNVPHNVYMYPDTVIHTIKYGETEDYDWIPFEKLDNILSEKTIEEWEQEIHSR